MKYSIGVITARKSLHIFEEVADQLNEICDVTFLPYSTNMELTNTFTENASRFDAYIFSGYYSYGYITEYICRISKPYLILQLKDRDFYRAIAKIYTQYPGINFSRVLFDRVDVYNMIHIFKDVFSDDKYPLFPKSDVLQDSSLPRALLYDTSFNYYQEEWKKGRIDLVVTMLTNLEERLTAAGIPHYLLSASSQTVLDTFRELISGLDSRRLQESLVACCVIQIAHENPSEAEYRTVEEALNRFNSEQNKIFVIRRNDKTFDAITTRGSVEELTSNFTTCLLTSFLKEVLPFSTWIGWGISDNIVNAHFRATQAIQRSREDIHRYTYLVNENDEVVGPLCGNRSISYVLKADPAITALARNLGIAPLNLEKLQNLIQKKNDNVFCSNDLEFYLNITPRSAARILQKLVASGHAEKVETRHISAKGRPTVFYRLDL